MVIRWQINRISGLLAIKICCQHICFSNNLTPDQPPYPHPTCGGRHESEHNRREGRPALIGTLGVQQNIPASDARLMPSLFMDICHPLVMDKLILVNLRAITSPPKMSPLLEVECTPAVIIYPRLVLVMLTDDLVGTKRSN